MIRAAPGLALVGLLLLWDVVIRIGDVDPLVLPRPTVAGARMIDEFGTLMPEVWSTVKLMLIGLFLALAGGLLFAIIIVSFRPAELTLYPVVISSQVIPKIAIAPIIFIWFGLGTTSRLVIVFLLAFFPVVVASVRGLTSLEQTKTNLARSLGANRLQILLRFRVPNALPEIFAGAKLGATRAVGAAIVAEYLTPGPGLGRTILTSTSELRPDIALAAVAYLVIIGALLYYLMVILERSVIPWHISVRGSEPSH